MKSAFTFVMAMILLMVVSAVPVNAAENEYGTVKAWFNGENATVEGIKLKIGEPVDIKVTVTSKINGHIFVKLKEPGATKAYEVLSGPSKEGERIDNLNIAPGWSKTYTWTLAPNGAWKNGNAPINIFVQFSQQANDKIIQFSIANPYIIDEQYSGAAPTPEKTTEATGTPSSAGAPQSNTVSFPYLYLILIGAAIIVIFILFKLKK